MKRYKIARQVASESVPLLLKGDSGGLDLNTTRKPDKKTAQK
jgi:hypothetical protein